MKRSWQKETATSAHGYQRAKFYFFAIMKEMTLVGYYTSNVGMQQELGFYGFTGSYTGCVQLGGSG